MKISVRNLGVIRQAEFTLGDLTIICGGNNTGKTYVTHSTYGFLDYLRSNVNFPVEGGVVDRLFQEGSVSIPLSPYIENLQTYLDAAAKEYSEIMFRVFAGSESRFTESDFRFSLEPSERCTPAAIQARLGSLKKNFLRVSTSEDRKFLELTLLLDKESGDLPPLYIFENGIGENLAFVLLGNLIPKPFLASAERTGAAIFQKELDFTKNRLVEMLGDKSAKLHPVEFLGKFSGEYPIAVRKNVDFIRDLPNIMDRESFIFVKHPTLLESFRDIIGGEYRVGRNGDIQYVPSANKNVKLSLVESSSAIRSLLDIGFYLRCVAAPGDLLMVDEPELNLHPENQRRVARLFARLVNIGVKVFVTTHSDYIIKELNTLIMLHHDGDERLRKLAEREKYEDSELLDSRKVRVYTAEEALVKPEGEQRKTKRNTLVAANIDDRLGIEASSFDRTIEEMNRIQEEIFWGGSE